MFEERARLRALESQKSEESRYIGEAEGVGHVVEPIERRLEVRIAIWTRKNDDIQIQTI